MKKKRSVLFLCPAILVLFLLLSVWFTPSDAAVEEVTVGSSGTPTRKFSNIEKLTDQAFRATNPLERQQLWEGILRLDPRNGNAHLQLALMLFISPDHDTRERGMHLMEQSFDKTHVDDPIPMPSLPGMRMAMMLGRYRFEVKDFVKAYYFFQLGYRASLFLEDQSTAQLCVNASMATMLHPFPNTTQQADKMYDFFLKSARQFVEQLENNHQRLAFRQEELTHIPGGGNDPYVHCILTRFHLSFYYRADAVEATRLYYRVATSLWPQLVYVSPQVQTPDVPPHLDDRKPCTTGKIQLGIASGFLIPQSSVSADFGGVLQRLDRDIFNITYIHIHNRGMPTDPFVFRHPHQDGFLEFEHEGVQQDGAFVSRWYSKVEALHLDILLYLDLTMNTDADRLAMARLAPVQANSHGHPLTSGIPSVDYFISWGAAELPHPVANQHYSEELVLLDSDVPHQFYTPRHDSGGVSLINGEYFADKTHRAFFRKYMPEFKPLGGSVLDAGSTNWYTCMQKPHKFMPEMDPLLCGVLQLDPDGILILHQPDTPKMAKSLEQRLIASQCDMNRVYWFPVLPHHELLGLYSTSTLILDSYPAGGCTTTREALELHKVVVTLPARLLGGRWSFAYYQILNDDALNQHVIAASPEDYIQKAVRLGRDPSLRRDMEERIEKSLPRLYRNMEAVRSWERVLQKISPVERKDSCEIVV